MQGYDPLSIMRENISLSGASVAIEGAQMAAIQGDWQISVAIVDAAGQLVAFAKDDGAIGVTPEVAIAKARTAALLQIPSKDFETFVNSGYPSFLATPGITPLEGGIPLYAGNLVIGAIGVSGAHGANDTRVAEAGATAFRQASGSSQA